MRDLDDITGAIVDTGLRIHRELGPGLMESVYEAILARALEQRGFHVERQVAVSALRVSAAPREPESAGEHNWS